MEFTEVWLVNRPAIAVSYAVDVSGHVDLSPLPVYAISSAGSTPGSERWSRRAQQKRQSRTQDEQLYFAMKLESSQQRFLGEKDLQVVPF